MNPRLLFVYGSLRRGFQLHHHLKLLDARFLAKARVAAGLLDLGPYPAAHPVVRPGKWVHGELFRLRHPARDLRALDKVEGFTPGAPAGSEFVRAVAAAVLGNGARREAWIYWWALRNRPSRAIASGDYAAWTARHSSGGAHG